MERISLLRFNALAGYARDPMARILAEETGWFEHESGSVVGTVIRDLEDNDFSGVVMARDRKLRFRAVNIMDFYTTPDKAIEHLEREMDIAAVADSDNHHQGDERGRPVDFFRYSRRRDQLHPDFIKLAEEETYSPARQIIEPMMRWYEDPDGNFIEQFQTTGFDQRIWELYLFATFVEMGLKLDRSNPIPDFQCSSFMDKFSVEAVTVGPTMEAGRIVPQAPLASPEGGQAFWKNYMPIKFGSALFSKLRKKYWTRGNVAGAPFLLAVEDFSAPASMTYTRSALERYLFGYEYEWKKGTDGTLKIMPRRIKEHIWGKKRIPSGFFRLPESENVSAVIFSNSGTISKFNRMGVLGGFGSDRVLMVREGTSVNHDPNADKPIGFRQVVNAPDYSERWVEGLHVFHNPNAVHKLREKALPKAAHFYLQDDGQVVARTPDWHPLSSITSYLSPVDVKAALKELGNET